MPCSQPAAWRLPTSTRIPFTRVARRKPSDQNHQTVKPEARCLLLLDICHSSPGVRAAQSAGAQTFSVFAVEHLHQQHCGILGLAVIIPVIGLVVQPETIQTNTYLNRAFEITSSIGIDTPERFLILLCAIMIGAFLFKALFGLAVNLFRLASRSPWRTGCPDCSGPPFLEVPRTHAIVQLGSLAR